MTADALEAAVACARRGWHVIELDHPALSRCIGAHGPSNPCDGQRGKHPVGKWGLTATTDLEQIGAMFAGRARNIGIACKPSGLLVIDEDTPGELARLAADHDQPVPATYTVSTGRAGGGTHHYFAMPAGVTIGNATNLKDAGYDLDVRGNGSTAGGYVVAAGSVHATGVIYTADGLEDPAPAPQWLVELLTVKQAAATPGGDGDPFTGPEDKHSGPIPDGQRHAALISYAGRLRNLGLGLSEAQLLMERRWKDCAQPPQAKTPVTWDEARAKLEDVFTRYPSGKAPDAASTEVDTATDHADRYVDWAKLWALDADDVDWLADPLIARGWVGCIYAPAGAGKSLLSLDIAASLATGNPLLGAEPRQARVLYIDHENNEVDLRTRLTALGYGPDTDLSALRYSLLADWSPLDTPQGGQELLDAALEHQADLVVVDTVSRAVEGEEDSNDTARNAYRHTYRRLKAAGIAVLRLDHTGKDVERGERGGSGKRDDVDVSWLLIARTAESLTLRRKKSRQGVGPEVLYLRRQATPLAHLIDSVDEAYERQVDAIVDALDKLGLPDDTGRPTASKALKDAGTPVRNAICGAAVARRKLRAADLSPDPSGHLSPTVPTPVPAESQATVPNSPLPRKGGRGQVDTADLDQAVNSVLAVFTGAEVLT